jgi:predicted rRNA methylase YqxC with S4 and FtsJ domains
MSVGEIFVTYILESIENEIRNLVIYLLSPQWEMFKDKLGSH